MTGLLVLVVTMSAALLVILGCAVAILLAFRRLAPLQRARQQAMAAICAQRGLVLGAAHDDFAILGNFNNRQLTNSFSSPDHGLAVADYIRPAGKSVELFSLLAFTVAGLKMPYVSVTRRGLGVFMLGGPPALELESIDFDQRFTVRAKDRRSAVMLLDPGVMQLLLDCADVNFLMVGDKALALRQPRRRAGPPAGRAGRVRNVVQVLGWLCRASARTSAQRVRRDAIASGSASA